MLAGDGVTCVSCGQPLTGKYCAQCGERALAQDEYTLRRFLAETFHDVSSVDAKLYRTLRLLVRRPGLLTVEYLQGRRVPYLRPIQLFLLANLVYFVIQPLTGYSGFNTNLVGHMQGQFYSQPLEIRSRVEQRVAQQGSTFENYEAAFNRRSSLYARSLTAVLIPLFSLAVAVMFAAKRRPLANHLIFATHFMAWQLLVVMSAFLLLLRVIQPYLSASFERASSAGLPGAGFLSYLILEFGSLLPGCALPCSKVIDTRFAGLHVPPALVQTEV
jgi:Protein of unknown function (DUF3667)